MVLDHFYGLLYTKIEIKKQAYSQLSLESEELIKFENRVIFANFLAILLYFRTGFELFLGFVIA